MSGPATLVGTASWYDAGPGYFAALPGHRAGRHVLLVVCRLEDDHAPCVIVAVATSCQCYVDTPRERIVDLSRAAFARLAPLGRGLIRVSMREMP